MKTCSRCLIEKPLSEFSIRRNAKQIEIPRSQCKKCVVELSLISQAQRRERDPEGWRAYRARYKRDQVYRRYGITREQVQEMGEAQDWRCYICGIDISAKPYLDHSHFSGKVRKLLCFHCNVGLGHFQDSIVLLDNAI